MSFYLQDIFHVGQVSYTQKMAMTSLPNLMNTTDGSRESSSQGQHNKDNQCKKEILYPAVPMYAPHTIRGLRVGDKKLWCACGLSKKQPWCDGSHVGTGIEPVKWTVTKTQVLHQVCGCKYTRDPPYCDGTHTCLPCDVIARQGACERAGRHLEDTRLCTGCGWVPDF